MCELCINEIIEIHTKYVSIKGALSIFHLSYIGLPRVDYPNEQVAFVTDTNYYDIHTAGSAKVLSCVLDRHYDIDSTVNVFVAGVQSLGKRTETGDLNNRMNRSLKSIQSNWRAASSLHICNKKNKSRTGVFMRVRPVGFLELVQGTV